MDLCETQESASERSDVKLINNSIYDYAYTINIAPYKRIVKLGRWDTLKPTVQKMYLKALVLDAIEDAGIDRQYRHDSYFNFEVTKNGNTHIHGSYQASTTSAHMFVDFIHKRAGLPRCKPYRVCMIVPTEIDHSFWIRYRQKETNNDPYMFKDYYDLADDDREDIN